MLIYRELTENDIDTLAAFRLEMFRDMGAIRDEPQARELLQESKTYFHSVFGTPHLLALLAEEEGLPIAAGVLSITQGAPSPGNLSGVEGYIYNLYTIPACRKRGIATQIFHRLMTIAKKRGVTYLCLFATQEGQPIYARQGFVPITTPAMKRIEED